jgi:hypothetical protein
VPVTPDEPSVAVHVPDWLSLLVQLPDIVLPSADTVPVNVAAYPTSSVYVVVMLTVLPLTLPVIVANSVVVPGS